MAAPNSRKRPKTTKFQFFLKGSSTAPTKYQPKHTDLIKPPSLPPTHKSKQIPHPPPQKQILTPSPPTIPRFSVPAADARRRVQTRNKLRWRRRLAGQAQSRGIWNRGGRRQRLVLFWFSIFVLGRLYVSVFRFYLSECFLLYIYINIY